MMSDIYIHNGPELPPLLTTSLRTHPSLHTHTRTQKDTRVRAT